MAKGFCAKCGIKIVFSINRKSRAYYCSLCGAARMMEWRRKNPEKNKESYTKYRKENPERVKENNHRHEDKRRHKRRHLNQDRCLVRRHKKLISRYLNHESIPESDLLRRYNFYIELIRDNECHYCLGSLGTTGVSLDRINNNVSHFCFNVVPCCKSCNQKKMHDTSYEEMMLLAPALREIRLRRESKIGDLNGNHDRDGSQSV